MSPPRHLAMSGNPFSCRKGAPVLVSSGRGQGCCSAPCGAQHSPHNKESSGPKFRSAGVEKPSSLYVVPGVLPHGLSFWYSAILTGDRGESVKYHKGYLFSRCLLCALRQAASCERLYPCPA